MDGPVPEGTALVAETHYKREAGRSQTERPRKLDLKIDDVLIFEEVLGPKTGQKADADPKRRHAVQLTSVRPIIDPVNGVPVVEIEWAVADALPFPSVFPRDVTRLIEVCLERERCYGQRHSGGPRKDDRSAGGLRLGGTDRGGRDL